MTAVLWSYHHTAKLGEEHRRPGVAGVGYLTLLLDVKLSKNIKVLRVSCSKCEECLIHVSGTDLENNDLLNFSDLPDKTPHLAVSLKSRVHSTSIDAVRKVVNYHGIATAVVMNFGSIRSYHWQQIWLVIFLLIKDSFCTQSCL